MTATNLVDRINTLLNKKIVKKYIFNILFNYIIFYWVKFIENNKI